MLGPLQWAEDGPRLCKYSIRLSHGTIRGAGLGWMNLGVVLTCNKRGQAHGYYLIGLALSMGVMAGWILSELFLRSIIKRTNRKHTALDCCHPRATSHLTAVGPGALNILFDFFCTLLHCRSYNDQCPLQSLPALRGVRHARKLADRSVVRCKGQAPSNYHRARFNTIH